MLQAMESQFRVRRRYLVWVIVGIELLMRNLQGIAARSGGQGFINIDCGAPPGSAYHNPATQLTFESDATKISIGETVTITADSAVTDLSTLRYFPAARSPRKNCYDVGVISEQLYLVRAWFRFGGYTAVPDTGIHFQLAVDETVWKNVTIDTTSNASSSYEEVILLTTKSQTVVSICLIRMDSSDPFISSLELRPIGIAESSKPYITALDNTAVILRLIERRNFGEPTTTYRYPDDELADRIWPPWPDASAAGVTSVTLPPGGQPISYSNDTEWQRDRPPQAVMSSAMTHPDILNYSITLDVSNTPSESAFQAYVSLFFAEINNTASSGLQRVMDVLANFNPTPWNVNLTAFAPSDTYQYAYPNQTIPADLPVLTFTLRPDTGMGLPPLLNAAETYQIIPLASPTNPRDVSALATVKEALNYSRWTGYPCNPVPWDEIICTDNAVTSLDLSGKNLSGMIPNAIQDLIQLTNLNLSDNQFLGPLPEWIAQLPALHTLDVSNNNLSGTFPATYITEIDDFRYSRNDQLHCIPSGNAVCPGTKSKSPIWAIVGGVLGGALLLCIIFVYIWFSCCKKPTTREAKLLGCISDDGTTPQTRQPSSESHHPGRKAQPYALSRVVEATNSFARKLGEGGFGPVYYGKLKDQEVAVKVMSGKTQQGLSEYSNEIDLLSTVHHKKLVSLNGYCEEGKVLILLYEYMSGGDVRARLYGGDAAQQPPLTWRQRLHIALDAAKGLEYLHHGCNPAIFHRDVKSSNILLNCKLEAKVADFGLSKLTDDGQTHVMTMVKGTLGYLDPEYNTTGMLTDKSDVYSFGVVLMEILCGHPPIAQKGPYRFIVERVRAAINTGSLLAVVDPALQGDYKGESVWGFAEIALRCVAPVATARPTMSRVVCELCEALRVEDGGQFRSTGDEYCNNGGDNLSCSRYKREDPSQIFYTDVNPR